MSWDAPTADTDDLRRGVAVDDSLLALLPLIGRWQGVGVGLDPDGRQFGFGQTITFVHDGRAFLVYEARSWFVDEDGTTTGPGDRETGFWCAGRGQDDVAVAVVVSTGRALSFDGRAGDNTWELRSRSVAHPPALRPIEREERIYTVRDDDLIYVAETVIAGQAQHPTLNGRLTRLPSRTRSDGGAAAEAG